jgi:hypothetical protein
MLTLQPTDHDEISQIPLRWRGIVTARILILTQFWEGLITKVEAIRRMRVSRPTFDRLVANVRRKGWRGLVPKYKGVGAPVSTALTPEFIDFWKRLVENNQRKIGPAYRTLLRLWNARVPFLLDEVKHPHIPGYPGWPGWPDLPKGWDERTLYRHQPSKLELTAMRQGLGAAMKHAPKVLSTRVGLWHLSHIVWDDVWLDMKTHVLKQRQLCRVLQIGALDLRSGSRFHYGMKPQLRRDDGTRSSLTEADMRFALASQLHQFGISPRGTEMIIEHGTATIRGNVRDILKRSMGDLIRFSESGMTGKIQAIAGMGDGKGGGGNFRHKAALESLHNLIHNELASLPGQTGHDRNEPEFLGVMERESEQLWRIAKSLPPEIVALLKYPVFEYHSQLAPIVRSVLHQINCRTDHNLEGWVQSGFITREYRLMPGSNEWMTEPEIMALPGPVREAYFQMASHDQRCFKCRNLSPHEVFTQGHTSGQTMQVPTSVIAEILYQDLAQPHKCQDSYIRIKDQEIAPETMWFEGRVTRPDGREEELKAGETYDCVVNPFDPKVLWVYAARIQRGAFLGTARLQTRHNRTEIEASVEAFKRAKTRLADQLTETRSRHLPKTRAAAARYNHNAAVIAGHKSDLTDLTHRATDALDHALDHSPQTDNEPQTTNTSHDINDLW